MTNEELLQLKYLKSEIKILRKQIEDIDYSIVTDSVKGSSKHFPYTEHSILITGIDYEGHKNKVNRLKRKLDKRLEEYIDRLETMIDYISNIDDSYIRQILTLRYIADLSWSSIAHEMGGNNSANGVRMIAQRYLK